MDEVQECNDILLLSILIRVIYNLAELCFSLLGPPAIMKCILGYPTVWLHLILISS